MMDEISRTANRFFQLTENHSINSGRTRSVAPSRRIGQPQTRSRNDLRIRLSLLGRTREWALLRGSLSFQTLKTVQFKFYEPRVLVAYTKAMEGGEHDDFDLGKLSPHAFGSPRQLKNRSCGDEKGR
jgi:hypothetical protein